MESKKLETLYSSGICSGYNQMALQQQKQKEKVTKILQLQGQIENLFDHFISDPEVQKLCYRWSDTGEYLPRDIKQAKKLYQEKFQQMFPEVYKLKYDEDELAAKIKAEVPHNQIFSQNNKVKKTKAITKDKIKQSKKRINEPKQQVKIDLSHKIVSVNIQERQNQVVFPQQVNNQDANVQVDLLSGVAGDLKQQLVEMGEQYQVLQQKVQFWQENYKQLLHPDKDRHTLYIKYQNIEFDDKILNNIFL